MITIADLDRILTMMQDHGLDTLRVKEGKSLLMLRLSAGPVEKVAKNKELAVRAKAVGRFLRSHPGQNSPLVETGDQVREQTIVGLIENGPVLLPILAGQAGEIGRIEAEDGRLVGYGDKVMSVLTKG